MSRRIRRRREVASDIVQNARFIAKDSMDAALRFFDAVEETAKLVHNLEMRTNAGHDVSCVARKLVRGSFNS